MPPCAKCRWRHDATGWPISRPHACGRRGKYRPPPSPSAPCVAVLPRDCAGPPVRHGGPDTRLINPAAVPVLCRTRPGCMRRRLLVQPVPGLGSVGRAAASGAAPWPSRLQGTPPAPKRRKMYPVQTPPRCALGSRARPRTKTPEDVPRADSAAGSGSHVAECGQNPRRSATPRLC